MRCEDVRDNLAAFASGEAPVDVRLAIRAHLGECAECLAAMSRVDALAGVLVGVEAPPIPVGFSGRVMAAAGHRHGAEYVVSRRSTRWWGLTSAPMRAAAAVAAFLIGAWGAKALSTPAPSTAIVSDTRPVAETALSNWFEAAPGDSVAFRYLDAIDQNDMIGKYNGKDD
jgi:anti-sigma factor RsiW